MPSIIGRNVLTRKLWQQIRNLWDASNNQWNQWVINYGPKRQKEFLGQFGLQDINWSSMIFLIMAFSAVIFLYLIFILLRAVPRNKDPVKRLYNQFCKKLSRCGIHHDVYEGPVAFASRAAFARSDLASQINNITDIYVAIRYGSNKNQIPAMQKRVRAFKPSSRQH